MQSRGPGLRYGCRRAIMDALWSQTLFPKSFRNRRSKTNPWPLRFPDTLLSFKKIPLPIMQRGRTQRVDPMEAEQHIPFDISDVNWLIRCSIQSFLIEHTDVLLVAVKKDKILNHTNVITKPAKSGRSDIDASQFKMPSRPNYSPASNSTWRNSYCASIMTSWFSRRYSFVLLATFRRRNHYGCLQKERVSVLTKRNSSRGESR